jgi:hypothetical protein
MAIGDILSRIGALLNSPEPGEITDEQIAAAIEASRRLHDTSTSNPAVHTACSAPTSCQDTNDPSELAATVPPQPARLSDASTPSQPRHRNKRSTCTRHTLKAPDPVLPGESPIAETIEAAVPAKRSAPLDNPKPQIPPPKRNRRCPELPPALPHLHHTQHIAHLLVPAARRSFTIFLTQPGWVSRRRAKQNSPKRCSKQKTQRSEAHAKRGSTVRNSA